VHAFQQARFVLSAAQPQDIPPRAGGELVFAGRSNVGKSSAINALAGRKRLAFASKTPGRTRMLNFFELGGGARLVDLPGYGYAAAPRALRATWDALIGAFLVGRGSFAGIVLLTDSRRPLAPGDRQFLDWLGPVAGPRLILLSKADKLSRSECAEALAGTQRALARSGMEARAMLFSAKSGEGVEEARALLEEWLAQIKNPR
jgi:GTP-binding protein